MFSNIPTRWSEEFRVDLSQNVAALCTYIVSVAHQVYYMTTEETFKNPKETSLSSRYGK